jgi:hypothetical protein
MAHATNTAVVEQLRMWAEELEQEKDAPARPVEDTGTGFAERPAS